MNSTQKVSNHTADITVNRSFKWDNVKFVLIFLVVLGHIIQSYSNTALGDSLRLFIYSFHMPAFVFVSGLFSKSTVKKRRYDRIFSFFALYLFIKLLLIAVDVIQGSSARFTILNDFRISWYMIAMAAFMLITIAVSSFKKAYVLIVAVLFACLAGYSNFLESYALFNRVIFFFPFFFAGYCIETDKLEKLLTGIWVKIASAAFLVALLIVFFVYNGNLAWLINVFKGVKCYADYKYFSNGGMLIRLLYYAFASITIFCFYSLIPAFKTFFTTFGSRTLQVYVFHLVFIQLIFDVFGAEKLITKLPFSLGFLILIAAALTFLLSLRIFEPIVNTVSGNPPKRVNKNLDSQK